MISINSSFRAQREQLLMNGLNEVPQQRWTETVSNIDFNKSNGKEWSLLRKLGGGPKFVENDNGMHPERIVSHVYINSPIRQTQLKCIKHEVNVLKGNN